MGKSVFVGAVGSIIICLRFREESHLFAQDYAQIKLKSLLMKVEEESEKAGLKLNNQKLRSWHPVPSLHCSKITADGDCSHEIKRHLFLGRKVMTNLDSIFKSRDITLPTKVCLVKAMVFPVVMYGCESWTVKKAEHQRIDSFEL